MRLPRRTAVGLLFLVGLVVLSACSSTVSAPLIKTTGMAMPDYVQSALPAVQEAYRFAAANPHALETVPCYCGCVKMGHKNNLDCYISNIAADGKITFDNHAAYCGVCSDITHDVMRLQNEGKSALAIRTYVDAHYSSIGPSTNTVMPVG